MVDYVNVKVPIDLADEVDEVCNRKIRGFRNRGEFTNAAIRFLLDSLKNELRKPPFVHVNFFEDHASVKDSNLDKEINIYFQHGKLFCEHCDAHNCEHIRFMLEKEDFRKRLKDKGVVF